MFIKYSVVVVILVVLFCSFVPLVSASNYVLPYPSYMPGNKLYTIMRYVDIAKGWWSWGNIASAKYHMSLADKNLVEAKTLFEYKQYRLGVNALQRSNQHAPLVTQYLQHAAREGKDISELKTIYASWLEAHTDVLTKLLQEVPREFLWQPEKQSGQTLKLHDLIQQSLQLRQSLRGL